MLGSQRNYKYYFLIVLILGLGLFFYVRIKEKVNILENYNFNKGNWFIVKGYADDTVQYVLENKETLNNLKNEWNLSKSDDNFATTGGYNISIYNNSQRIMWMDIINDGLLSRKLPGKLFNSKFGTLTYNNLNWIDLNSDKWIKTKKISKQFENIKLKNLYLDSLNNSNKVFILYNSDLNSDVFIDCLIEEK